VFVNSFHPLFAMSIHPSGAVNRRKVLIKIIEAKNLMKVDLIGQPSPFVALDMNGHEKDVKQTSVKKDTVNPAWGEEFEFTVMDEVNDVLVLHISDFHKLRANTFMGVAHIPIMPLTLLKAPMDYWFDLIDKKALSKATSKKERGAIHVHMTWTDAEGRTWNEPNPSVNPAQHYSAEVLDRAAVRQAEIAERMELQREAEMQTAAQAHQNAGSFAEVIQTMRAQPGPPVVILGGLEQWLNGQPNYFFSRQEAVDLVLFIEEEKHSQVPGMQRLFAILQPRTNEGDFQAAVQSIRNHQMKHHITTTFL